MNFFLIKDLTTNLPVSSSSRWTIIARVTSKTAKRDYHKENGQGKYFSTELRDKSGAIRAVAFNDDCDKFYDKIEVGKVYYISCGKVQDTRPEYLEISPSKNKYEIKFTQLTSITPLEVLHASIPPPHLETLPITDLQKRIDGNIAAQSHQESSSSTDYLPPCPDVPDDEVDDGCTSDQEDTDVAPVPTASSQGPTAQNDLRIEFMQKEHELCMKVLELKRKKSNLKIALLEQKQKHEAEIFKIKKAKLQ